MTAQARKTSTPATAPVTTRKAKVQAPDLDFSKITATAAPAPVRKGGVSTANNPAMAWVRESWEKKTAGATANGTTSYRGEGRQVVVPTANAGQVETLIRKAAIALGKELNLRIGASIVREELTGADKGKTAVRFCAKTGKAPYTKKATTPATTTSVATGTATA